MREIRTRLAKIPNFAKTEYHPDQVMLYSKFAEITFKVLNLPFVAEFMEKLAKTLDLEAVEVRVLRMPAARSKVTLIHRDGKPHLIWEDLKGRFGRKSGLIDVYPDLIWPRRLMKPIGLRNIGGLILNSSIRVLIHEMIHQSGIRDEGEVRRLADQYYEDFKRIYPSRFDEECKPLLKEWETLERKLAQQKF